MAKISRKDFVRLAKDKRNFRYLVRIHDFKIILRDINLGEGFQWEHGSAKNSTQELIYSRAMVLVERALVDFYTFGICTLYGAFFFVFSATIHL